MLKIEAGQVLQMARVILERNAGNSLSPDLIAGMLRAVGENIAALVKEPEPEPVTPKYYAGPDTKSSAGTAQAA